MTRPVSLDCFPNFVEERSTVTALLLLGSSLLLVFLLCSDAVERAIRSGGH